MIFKTSFPIFGLWLMIKEAVCFSNEYGAPAGQRPSNQEYLSLNPYSDQNPPAAYRCSGKLEDALDHMLRRNEVKSGSRSQIEFSPYLVYQSIYGNSEKIDSVLNEKLDNDFFESGDDDSEERQQVLINKIEVAEMRVRLPANTKRWVVVDKCQFNARNSTLDTRLIFPDLTIKGRVTLQPNGGSCKMILRLRRAGIEFRTTPLEAKWPGQTSRRSGTASVRTDSHFSEPGFLSVFAHDCQAPPPKYRENSKRNRFSRMKRAENKFTSGRGTGGTRSNSRLERRLDTNVNENDSLHFNDAILDDVDLDETAAPNYQDGRSSAFSQIFQISNANRPIRNQWHNAETVHSDEITDALSGQLEQLFSIGVRSLLTTYMQKTLQPAIKETLMENMGYVLSYG